MPLLNLHLLALSGPLPHFLSSLRTSLPANDIIAVSQPRYLYIPSTAVDAAILNQTSWDLFLLTRQTGPLPKACLALISQSYHLTIGVPGKLLSAYPAHNAHLLRSAPNVPLTGSLDKALNDHAKTAPKSSGENLELSGELLGFMEGMVKGGEGARPVSMLNLLRFHEGGRDGYIRYGQGFRKAGGRRGGDAKIVGAVVRGEGEGKGEGWDEVAFVHYPSIRHFADMTAGEDYQEINQKYRLGALKDTLLLCTTETDLLGQWQHSKL